MRTNRLLGFRVDVAKATGIFGRSHRRSAVKRRRIKGQTAPPVFLLRQLVKSEHLKTNRTRRVDGTEFIQPTNLAQVINDGPILLVGSWEIELVVARGFVSTILRFGRRINHASSTQAAREVHILTRSVLGLSDRVIHVALSAIGLKVPNGAIPRQLKINPEELGLNPRESHFHEAVGRRKDFTTKIDPSRLICAGGDNHLPLNAIIGEIHPVNNALLGKADDC